jgi:hypothetical protein
MSQINWSNVSNFNDYLQASNTGSEGLFWITVVYLIFAVILISMSIFSFEAAILTAAFIGLILSLMLAFAGLVGFWVVGTFVGIILFMLLYLNWINPRE